MKTLFKSKEDAIAGRGWYIVDATGVPLGRLATEVATLIRGKHKPDFTPHVDGGDFVVVLNASKVKLTGKKMSTKTYFRHTGYIGGIKETSAEQMLEKYPDRMITKAVKGMLPKGALGHQLITKLKVYANEQHPHQAQQPQQYKLKYVEQIQ
jgi:large subunit ribosomal protein L13